MGSTSARWVALAVACALTLAMLGAVLQASVPPARSPPRSSPTVAMSLPRGHPPAQNLSTEALPEVVGNITVGLGIGELPQTPVYDPTTGEVYISNLDSDSVSVVSGASPSVVASIATGDGPSSPVLDPSTDQLFISDFRTSNVTVVSASTGVLVATVPVGPNPLAGAFDAADQEVYIPDQGSNLVSVLDPSNDSVVATVQVGTSPGTPTVDASTGYVYVPSSTPGVLGNVSVIDPETNLVVANVTVGYSPGTPTFCPADGDVYVPNTLGENITILSGLQVVGSLGVGSDPGTPWYLPGPEQLVVANSGSGNVSVIDPNTNAVVETIPVGDDPQPPVGGSDPTVVYVAEFGSRSVSVVSVSQAKVTSTVSLVPYSPLTPGFDPATGDLFVPSSQGSNVSVLSTASNSLLTVLGPMASPGLPVVDPTTGDLYVSEVGGATNVAVLSTSSDRLVGSIPVGESPQTPTLDPATGDLFVSNLLSDNVSVISPMEQRVVATVDEGFELYSPTFDPQNGNLYFPDQNTTDTQDGVVVVLSGSSAGILGNIRTAGVFPNSTTILYDPENGDLYQANGYFDNVSVIDGKTDKLLTTVVPADHQETLYSPTYDPQTQDVYVPDYVSANISVISSETNAFVRNVAVGGNCVLCDPDGPISVTFDPSNDDLYVSEEWGDNVTVIDGATDLVVANIPVGWDPQPATYDPVDQAILVSNSWSGNVSVINGTSNTVVSSLPVGGHPLSPVYDPTDGDLYVANPGSGTVSILATQALPLAVAQFVASPSVLDLGQSTDLKVSVVNGVGALTYAYTGLPRGCASANLSSLACTPTGEGTFSITVQVGSSTLQTASAVVELVINQSLEFLTVGPSGPVEFPTQGTQVWTASVENSTGADLVGAQVTWSLSPASLGALNSTTGTVVELFAGSATGSGSLWVNATFGGATRGSSVQLTVLPSAPTGGGFLGLPGDQGWWVLAVGTAGVALLLILLVLMGVATPLRSTTGRSRGPVGIDVKGADDATNEPSAEGRGSPPPEGEASEEPIKGRRPRDALDLPMAVEVPGPVAGGPTRAWLVPVSALAAVALGWVFGILAGRATDPSEWIGPLPPVVTPQGLDLAFVVEFFGAPAAAFLASAIAYLGVRTAKATLLGALAVGVGVAAFTLVGADALNLGSWWIYDLPPDPSSSASVLTAALAPPILLGVLLSIDAVTGGPRGPLRTRSVAWAALGAFLGTFIGAFLGAVAAAVSWWTSASELSLTSSLDTGALVGSLVGLAAGVICGLLVMLVASWVRVRARSPSGNVVPVGLRPPPTRRVATLAPRSAARPSPTAGRAPPKPATTLVAVPVPPGPLQPVPAAPPSRPRTDIPAHHKLSVGELLILHVDDTHVETASNIDGRFSLERHARPSRSEEPEADPAREDG